MNNHSRVKQDYPCTWKDCKASLKSPEGVKSHLRRVHIAPKERVKCDICSKDYSDQSDLRRHIKFIHVKPEKKFKCEICELQFFTCKHLERHMQTHEGNSFPCWFSGCLTKRSTMYDLRHHYKKRHDVVRHQKDYIPISKRPHLTCELCGKKLKAGASPNSTLRLHMKKHAAQTLDTCPEAVCDYKLYSNYDGYTVPGQVYQHLLATHGRPAHQVNTVYQCRECEARIVCVQRGVRKPYEEWSKMLVEHMVIHGEDGGEEVGEDGQEQCRKYISKLKGKEWRTMFKRHLEFNDSKRFLDEEKYKDSHMREVDIKLELLEVDVLESNVKKEELFEIQELENTEEVDVELLVTDDPNCTLPLHESRELTEVEYHKAFVDVVSRIPVVFLNRVSSSKEE